MSDQVRRSRAFAAAAAVAMVMAVAGCGESGAPAAGSSATATATAAPSASAKYDAATMRACEFASKAVELDGEESFQATGSALAAAELSDVQALRQIAVKYASDGTTAGNISANAGAIRIQTWCIDHDLTRPGG